MLERIGGAAIVLGIVLMLAGALWLLVRLLRTMFGNMPWGRLRAPLGLLFVAAAMIATPLAINFLKPIDLGPHEQTVDGEIHLTLTGWDRADYDRVLAERSQAVVLQMANGDVTDDTLKRLPTMTHLRELDVNDTQITDDSLATLAELPNLESLRVARTAITDAGFRLYLLEKASLKQLDLTSTAVASKTVREWKARQAGRQVVK